MMSLILLTPTRICSSGETVQPLVSVLPASAQIYVWEIFGGFVNNLAQPERICNKIRDQNHNLLELFNSCVLATILVFCYPNLMITPTRASSKGWENTRMRKIFEGRRAGGKQVRHPMPYACLMLLGRMFYMRCPGKPVKTTCVRMMELWHRQ
jgi:hypothetical protein